MSVQPPFRRRKEDADPVGSEKGCLLYNLNMLCSDLNRSLYTSGIAEEILTQTIVYRVFWSVSADFDLSTLYLHWVWIAFTFIITLRTRYVQSDRHRLALGNLENNICHVVHAYEMLTNDVCCCARAWVGPWLGPTLCDYIHDTGFAFNSHVWMHRTANLDINR